jgi:5-oxoprolinase (ATP-hydrolysing) subunit A
MKGAELKIDLNCDMGELPEAIADGTQEALMRSITSVNVACGGHAGDDETMKTTIEQALRSKVAIGAHPGYADRANFGRVELKLPPNEIATSVFEQVRALSEVAKRCGAHVVHVKPHGALYNQAVHNRELAEAIAEGVAQWRRDVVLVGLAGSPMLDVFRKAGFAVAAEAFVDRRYEPDGTLRSRKFEDALILNPEEAARQALGIAEQGLVIAIGGSEVSIDAQTLCIHGDTPGAPVIAATVAQALRDAGVSVGEYSR